MITTQVILILSGIPLGTRPGIIFYVTFAEFVIGTAILIYSTEMALQRISKKTES